MQESTRTTSPRLAAGDSNSEGGPSVPEKLAFSKVTFSSPRFVLGETVGMISTEQNQASRRVDSITADGYWVFITRDGETRCFPASCIEEATPLPELAAAAEPGAG